MQNPAFWFCWDNHFGTRWNTPSGAVVKYWLGVRRSGWGRTRMGSRYIHEVNFLEYPTHHLLARLNNLFLVIVFRTRPLHLQSSNLGRRLRTGITMS